MSKEILPFDEHIADWENKFYDWVRDIFNSISSIDSVSAILSSSFYIKVHIGDDGKTGKSGILKKDISVLDIESQVIKE